MISVSSVWRRVVSQERALANARAAAVECSRRRVEAAEVADYLERLRPAAESWTAPRVAERSR